jgi:exo-beta-1,3-glucanase (GH17 family)
MSRPDKQRFQVKSGSWPDSESRRANYKVPGFPALLGTDFSAMSRPDKIECLRAILAKKIHGISFSPYLRGQSPGDVIAESQIRDRMRIIAPYTRWVRSFSCLEGHEATPRVAREMGLKTMVGIGLSDKHDINEEEMRNGIELAQNGYADILAVGNEVMLRGELDDDQLIAYIRRAQEAVPGIPVGTVDAYFLFEDHPRVTEVCDTLLVNCYPFWESCPAEYAVLYMKEMYRRAQAVAHGKDVIVSETGWPTQGTPFGDAVPSFDHALEYFIRTYDWAYEDDIDIFYFSSFDESWKIGPEGDVGAYWGLWDEDGKLKYG